MNFNGADDEVVVSNGKPLMPYEVHTVEFKSIEIKEGGTWKMLSLNFFNENGSLALSIFRPNEKDGERREVQMMNGNNFYTPSNSENTWACLQQLMKILNPTGYEKAKAIKIKNFDDAFAVVVKVLTPVIGTTTNIKVRGYMKNGYIAYLLPNVTTLVDSKDIKSNVRQNDYFVGEKVFLSNNDLKQKTKFMKEYEAAKNATPTDMSAKTDSAIDTTPTTTANTEVEDINIDDLGL